jgi:hypothetical protein
MAGSTQGERASISPSTERSSPHTSRSQRAAVSQIGGDPRGTEATLSPALMQYWPFHPKSSLKRHFLPAGSRDAPYPPQPMATSIEALPSEVIDRHAALSVTRCAYAKSRRNRHRARHSRCRR